MKECRLFPDSGMDIAQRNDVDLSLAKSAHKMKRLLLDEEIDDIIDRSDLGPDLVLGLGVSPPLPECGLDSHPHSRERHQREIQRYQVDRSRA
jgi:hypothetical protein